MVTPAKRHNRCHPSFTLNDTWLSCALSLNERPYIRVSGVSDIFLPFKRFLIEILLKHSHFICVSHRFLAIDTNSGR